MCFRSLLGLLQIAPAAPTLQMRPCVQGLRSPQASRAPGWVSQAPPSPVPACLSTQPCPIWPSCTSSPEQQRGTVWPLIFCELAVLRANSYNPNASCWLCKPWRKSSQVVTTCFQILILEAVLWDIKLQGIVWQNGKTNSESKVAEDQGEVTIEVCLPLHFLPCPSPLSPLHRAPCPRKSSGSLERPLFCLWSNVIISTGTEQPLSRALSTVP